MAACSVYGPRSRAQPLRAIERREPALNQQPVPSPPILIEQQHRLALRPDARRGARRLDLHQRHQAVHFRFHRRQSRQHASEPLRVLAERRPHPVVAGGGGVALVENQVDHFEHRREPHGELGPGRHFVRHLLFGERALGADDALLNGRFGGEKRPRNLRRGEAGQQLQRQRHARFGRQHRMTRGEDQPQQIIADIVFESGVEVGHVVRLHFVDQLLVLVLGERVMAEVIDAAAFGDRHQPRRRIARNALGRPLFERRDQRVLREVFGKTDIARHARQRRNQLRRLRSSKPRRWCGSYR